MLQSALLEYRITVRDYANQITRFEKADPTVRREIDYFLKAAQKISSVEDLLRDRRALTVALGAFQLEEQVDAKGLLRKLLTEDPNDPRSLVNRLVEPRYKSFVAAFGSLATDGGARLRTPEFQDSIVKAFKTNEFEKFKGRNDEAVREALFFRRMAPSITSLWSILGNRALAKVVRVTEGLPVQFAALEPDQQLKLLERKGVDPAKFRDPAFVEKYISRYLVLNELQNPDRDPTGGIAALFATPSGPGRGLDIFV